MKNYLIIAFSLVAFGCTSQKKVLNSWIGLKKSDIILSWGPPSRTADDGNGGEVLIYAHQVYAPQLNLNYWDYKMMYCDADGKIYHWKTTREKIEPTQLDVRLIN